jgi:preprotein translocase subunit SecA
MYDKLAGMTGTAATEAEEFAKIYKLDVTVIPTNRDLKRVNHPDVVYKTGREKFDAVSNEIAECHEKGQPVLVGTVSIEKSEQLSKLLKRRGIPHQVLNAKYHEREAEIIAQAGREKAVTIATNMAGRGTDILLGGNPDFLAKALLSKSGLDPATAPAEAREQGLATGEEDHRPGARPRGRTGRAAHHRHRAPRVAPDRQSAPGPLRAPGRSRLLALLSVARGRPPADLRLRAHPAHHGSPGDGGRRAHRAQARHPRDRHRAEAGGDAELRDSQALLEYDDVMNKQREIVYGIRRQCLEDENQEPTVLEWMGEVVAATVALYAPAGAHPEDWDWVGLNEALHRQFELRLAPDVKDSEILSQAALVELVTTEVERVYRVREAEIGPEMFHRLERWIMLGLEWEGGGFRGINQLWREHLLNMDHLKEGIGLRGYGQRDPLTEYKKEAFDIFQEMIEHLKEVVVEQLFKVRSTREEAAPVRTALASPPVRQSLWQESRGSSPDSSMPGGPRPGPLRHARRAPHRRRAEGRPQRSVSLRLGQEVQEVLPLERCLA